MQMEIIIFRFPSIKTYIMDIRTVLCLNHHINILCSQSVSFGFVRYRFIYIYVQGYSSVSTWLRYNFRIEDYFNPLEPYNGAGYDCLTLYKVIIIHA